MAAETQALIEQEAKADRPGGVDNYIYDQKLRLSQ
jgi:hypothetical protein